jgi:hypothetical protein
MELTSDEQCLIEKFRKLPPSARDELLAYAASLPRRAGSDAGLEPESAPNQCRLKDTEQRPETEKSPFFTE